MSWSQCCNWISNSRTMMIAALTSRDPCLATAGAGVEWDFGHRCRHRAGERTDQRARGATFVYSRPVAGVVYLVGAGPGDPALLTRRGADLLRRAQAVVYDGLVNAVLLDLAPPDCERIYAGKKHAAEGTPPLSQEAINQTLVRLGCEGKRVVRLKGGDPFVFGRGAEECHALLAAGVRFEVVPGVTSATAVAAYAGIPLTARSTASTVVFATGHEAAGKPSSHVDWQALAHAGTVVLFMALKTIRECAASLIAAGKPAATPAAAVYWGTTASQRTIATRLDALADAVAGAGLRPPVLIVVGEVVELRAELAWYERRPLFGTRVLITRGLEQAREFAGAMAELGAEPVIAPVTRLQGPDAAQAAALAAALDRLGEYRWVLFTSANGVAQFFDALAARERDARALAALRIACVGAATAAAAAQRGVRADLVPARGDGAGVGAAMITADSNMRGARVLFPRAADGRDDAVEALTAAGAAVDVVPVYRTAATERDDPRMGHPLELLHQDAIDVVAFFAPSQVEALYVLLGERAAAILGGCRVIAAIGRSTAAACEARGLAVHVVASAPNTASMASAIAAYFQRDS